MVDPEIFNALVSTVERIEQTLGAASGDGTGGAGLVGQVTRVEATVDGLITLRNIGRGIFGLR